MSLYYRTHSFFNQQAKRLVKNLNAIVVKKSQKKIHRGTVEVTNRLVKRLKTLIMKNQLKVMSVKLTNCNKSNRESKRGHLFKKQQ